MKTTKLQKLVDSLVDEDGLKTEVTITMTDSTLIKTSAYTIGTVVACSFSFFIIRDLFIKK